MDPDWEEEHRRRQEHETELRWKRYESPSRRRLAERYYRPRDEHEVSEDPHEPADAGHDA